jgi:hypothetical protein
MLDAVCPGQVFTSPTPDQIEAATRAVDGGAGVRHIVKNCTGDLMNFEIAVELCEAQGAPVRSVVIDDDAGAGAQSRLGGGHLDSPDRLRVEFGFRPQAPQTRPPRPPDCDCRRRPVACLGVQGPAFDPSACLNRPSLSSRFRSTTPLARLSLPVLTRPSYPKNLAQLAGSDGITGPAPDCLPSVNPKTAFANLLAVTYPAL